MTDDHTLAFLLFAVVAAITPGPSNIVLASTGAAVGVRRGLPCLFGIATGMGLLMFFVAFGLGRLVVGNPGLTRGLQWAGASLLLWLSWKIATSGRSDGTAATSVVGFWGMTAFQWVNPKSWLITASAASTYLHAGAADAIVQATYFGVLFALAVLPSCFVWLAFGATVQRALRTERAARAFNVTMATLLAGSIVLVVR